MRNTRARTAILPVAGLGTRLLPATKAVPKELLPVFDTPLLQFALDEAAEAGMERLVIVNHPSKQCLEAYLEKDGELPGKLRRQGKTDLAAALERTGPHPRLETRFVYQDAPLGLGHAVLCAAEASLDGPVAVLLPDDLILPISCLSDMIAAYDTGRAELMVAAMNVPPDEISRYGAFDVTSREGAVLHACGIVEKPNIRSAPSHFAAVGRYILPSDIFGALEKLAPGYDGEIQLTDAIAALAESHGLEGYLFEGERFDCGNHEGLLMAGNRRRQEAALKARVFPASIAAQ